MEGKHIRVLLDLSQLKDRLHKYVWMLVSTSDQKNIADFKDSVIKKLALDRNAKNIKMFINGGLLLEDENILVLRENDAVQIQYEDISTEDLHIRSCLEVQDSIISHARLISELCNDKLGKSVEKSKKKKRLSEVVIDEPSSCKEYFHKRKRKKYLVPNDSSENHDSIILSPEDSATTFCDINEESIFNEKKKESCSSTPKEDFVENEQNNSGAQGKSATTIWNVNEENIYKLEQTKPTRLSFPTMAKGAKEEDSDKNGIYAESALVVSDNESISKKKKRKSCSNSTSSDAFIQNQHCENDAEISVVPIEISLDDSSQEFNETEISNNDQNIATIEPFVQSNNCKKKKRKRRRKRRSEHNLVSPFLPENINNLPQPVKDLPTFNSPDNCSSVRKHIRFTSPAPDVKEMKTEIVDLEPCSLNGVSEISLETSPNESYIPPITKTLSSINERGGNNEMPVENMSSSIMSEAYSHKSFELNSATVSPLKNNYKHELSLKNPVSKSNEYEPTGNSAMYSLCPPLNSLPGIGTCIAFKLLELNENYSPEVSSYKLSPVERYALQFLESLQEPVSLEQLKLAEEEIEAQKKDWELGHLKALKQEEERLGDEDNPLFCSREASNQVYFSINGQEEMPMWAPPTPPTNENDIYMDCSMNFWYEPSFMHEAYLPPIFIKKETKRQKMDPIVSAVSTARKQKVRKDDMVSIPRSLFDRPSGAILKMRREVKLQKMKGLMVSPKTPTSPQFLPSALKQTGSLLVGKTPGLEGTSNPHVEKEEWHVQEDWALLQVIQDLQNIPLNLTVLSPAHTPNWDLGSEAVYAVFNRYHSAKACKARYENVIVPREEGKILYDTNPKKQKKTKGIYKTKNNRPMKTSQLFLQDNNQAFLKVARENFRIINENSVKRRAQERTPFHNASLKSSSKLPSILAENGIVYDQPLTPMQIAQMRSERIAREKQKNAPVVPLAMAPVLQTVTSPQVATATVVSQVPEQQQTTVTVATGSMHPHQAQAVLASLQAQQQLQLKSQASMALSKSLTSGIMVSSSTANTLASLTKALAQTPQATSSQNAAIAAALSNASIRNQRATTTMSVQEIVAAGGQVRAVSTSAPVVGGISNASAVVSVSNLAAVQLANSQRLAGATLSPVTTVASGTVTQLNPQAAATQRNIAQMTQMQQMRQNALRRETALKQQLKRIHSVPTPGVAAAAKSGQPRVAQQVTMKQAAVGRPMTEAEVTQLMKRQQQKHAVNVNLTASQILAQVQPQQVAISSGATLVKTVSSPLAIPVSAVTMGGVNINVSVPQGKAGVVQAKGATTITNQQLRQFQLQQQLLQARKGSKMTTANLTQITKVPGKGGVSAGTSVQIVPQGVKNLQTAMTVAQIQQAMKQLPQNMPVVVTATPSLSGVQQQPVGAVKATTLPSTTLTTSGVLKGSTALTQQAVTLAVRAAQGQQQLQIQVQQSPHPTLVTPQTQVVSTAALTQARMQLQPLQTVTVQQQQPIIQQQVDHQTTVTATPPTPAQLVQQTNTQMVQQAIQLAKQQQAQAAAAAAAAQQNKASPYTMRLRNPPK